MGEVFSTISPTITQNPIEVVIWVKTGVTTVNRDWIIPQVEEGLNRWETIPTCHLSFVTEIIEADTKPVIPDPKLLIVVCNQQDVQNIGVPAGGSFPWGGNPRTWSAAIADNHTIDWAEIATHEIGHTLGLGHSTLVEENTISYQPVMHWKAGGPGYPTTDDIAYISLAYPDPANPFLGTTGIIYGRLVIPGGAEPQPVSGINVVAVDTSTGNPVTARLSGPRTSPFPAHSEGEFRLFGVPPGEYIIRFRDGHSYHGQINAVSNPPDGNNATGMRNGYQADNFTEFETAPLTVTAGALINLGDIEVTIEPMDFDGYYLGAYPSSHTSVVLTPVEPALPNGQDNTPYELWMHVDGGLRDITATFSGLPPGLTGTMEGDPTHPNSGVHGNHFVRITGTPTEAGHYTFTIQLTDAAGDIRRFAFNLSVGPFEPDGLIAWYKFDGNTHDLSGNNYHAYRFGGTYVLIGNRFINRALSFDGVNDVLYLPNERAFDLPEFTIIMNLKLPATGPEDDWLITKGTHFGNFTIRRFGTSRGRPGYAEYVHQSHTGNWSSLIDTKPLPTDEFFTLAVSLSSTTFKSYLNGQLVQRVNNVPPPRYNNSPVTVSAGGYYRRNEYSRMIIDQLKLFRGALSDAEVAQHSP